MTAYSTSGISISAISPVGVPNDGGYVLEITGVFRDEVASVTLDDGAGGTYVCYSGKAGSANAPRPRSPTTLRCAVPVVPAGLYNVVVDQTGHAATLALAIFVYPPNRRSKTRDYRKMFANIFAVGNERPALESRTQITVANIVDQSSQVGDVVALMPTVSANPSSLRIKWTIPTGTLPAGLALNASTGAITGTLTTAAVSTFTLRASTIKGDVDQSIQWTVLNVDQFVVVFGDAGNPTSLTFDSHTIARASGTTSCVTWIAKLLTADGVCQWATKWMDKVGATTDISIGGVVVDDSGNVYVCGSALYNTDPNVKIFDVSSDVVPVYSRTMVNFNEAFITKYNSSGVHQWTRALYGGAGAGFDPVSVDRRSILLLSNGDILVGVNYANSFGSGALVLKYDDGAPTTLHTFTTNGQASCLVRINPAGAVVTHKVGTITGGTSLAVNRAYVMQKKNSDQGIALGQILTATTPTTDHWGAGEATPLDKAFAPGGASATKAALVHYAEAGVTTDWTADAQQSNDTKPTYPLGVDVDTAGNVYSVGEGQSFAAGTLKARSADWTTPEATIPSHSDGAYADAFYTKHNPAGALQWIKGLGAASTFAGSSEELLSDMIVKGTTPYLTGGGDVGALFKLDQGLASEQVLTCNGAPHTRYFYAKLNPADGTVVALKKVNGVAGTTITETFMAALRQPLVAVVGTFQAGGLTFAPGEGDVTLAAPAGAQVNSFVALVDSDTLALSLVKRLPTSSVGGNAVVCRARFVAGAKV